MPASGATVLHADLDASMDAIRTRFGGDTVGYLPVVLRDGGAVPDEFRELAEHGL
ncbi:hypothetical protein [Promicromonospora iranensis]|uniref:Uncharacterized protein n=1 Tax=Promicromonospora iranensis TaxID=1105144 RepID=A0ABU2CHB3_9MICO|nr:hypothetical protein [Promicromonospora iranensis]MDR7380726.1 hypothetical protein [Promicromonospora iranensis]